MTKERLNCDESTSPCASGFAVVANGKATIPKANQASAAVNFRRSLTLVVVWIHEITVLIKPNSSRKPEWNFLFQ